MGIEIGNAPCSWGVEFAEDPRNPAWETVLNECAAAGYRGIELGPVGFLPEDPGLLRDALDQRELTLIGGVVYRPFSDPTKWDEVLDGTYRTCRSLNALGAEHLVLIDSISPRRAPTAGRVDEAELMDVDEWKSFTDKLREASKIAVEEYGLTASIHAHAAGFIDFEPELERLLDETPSDLMKICFDTGHHSYAGFDPVAFMERHMERISYMHFKDIDPKVKAKVIESRTGFYEACAQGIFCTLGNGDVDFSAVRDVLIRHSFDGWCTVEQDCDPMGPTSPIDDARANRDYLASIGF